MTKAVASKPRSKPKGPAITPPMPDLKGKHRDENPELAYLLPFRFRLLAWLERQRDIRDVDLETHDDHFVCNATIFEQFTGNLEFDILRVQVSIGLE